MDLEQLYEEMEHRLTGYGIRLCRDPHMAEDLVQETFARATSHVSLLEQLSRSQQRKWLFSVMRNAYIDLYRSQRREEDLLAEVAREAASTQTNSQWEDIVSSLQEGERALLRRRYVEGYNSNEIGEALGVPAATVRSRLRKTINKLREQLAVE